MEVWILLAAAGSGYLARCWQNAQKTKGTSADEADPQDSTAGSSSQLPSARRRYRRFSPSGRRQVGKSFGGKGSHHQWGRLLLKEVNAAVEHSSDHKAGERVVSDGSQRESRSETHVVINDGKFCDQNSETSMASHNLVDCLIEIPENVTLSYALQSAQRKESSEFKLEHSRAQEDSTSGHLSVVNEGEDGSRMLSQENNARRRSPPGQASEGKSLADDCGSLLSRSSGKRLNESRNEKGHKGGFLPQDGYSGKRMKDALETMGSQEEFNFGGTWMPGFWDVSQGVFVLDADSLVAQQEGDGRSKGSSTRKIRTPNNKLGRSRGSMCRRKRLTTQKPMSSLESCLSAQLDVNLNQRAGGFPPLFCSPGGNALGTAFGRNLGHQVFGSVASEKVSCEGVSSTINSAIGLPSLSRQQNRRSSLNIIRRIRSRTTRASKGETMCIPFKGLPATSQDAMLFNFGVGVGIMFTIMSNKHEVDMLNELLREAESLIKDLEYELEGRCALRPECDPAKEDVEEDFNIEQRQLVLNSTLKKVRSATRSFNSMSLSLTEELELAQSDDMAKLEAELEAEFKRMELNMDDGNISKHHRKYSGVSEFDADIVGNIIQGELTVKGLPCEIEVESEEEDASDSSPEDLHVSSYSVSPRKLAERLHEVLEARQDQRIAELEAELRAMGSKLQAQEEQLQWWKDQSSGLTQGVVDHDISNIHQGALQNDNQTKELAEARVSLSTQIEKKRWLSSGNIKSHTVSPASPGVSKDASTYDMKNALLTSSSRFLKVPKNRNNPVFITLGGEALAAYNEAYDEFSKAFSDSDMGRPTTNSSLDKHDFSENAFLQDTDLSAVEACGLELFNSGVSEHWEQVDLLSLAEDFYVDADSEFMVNIPTFSKAPSRGRAFPKKSSRKKGTIPSHPEPEQSFTGPKAVDSSDDTTNDTSGSTPCSVKFMDMTVGSCLIDDQLKTEGEIGANSCKSPYSDWSEDNLIPAGANTPVVNNQEGKHSLYYGQKSLEIESPKSPGCLALKQGDQSLSEDCDYSSDLDEQLGQLLIKRIVEKSRKGSPIIQDAHTVLASFERNETTLDGDFGNSKDITAAESVPRENLDLLCTELFSAAAGKKGESTPYFRMNEGVSCQDSLLLSACTVESGFLNSITEWDAKSTTGNASQTKPTLRS